MKTKQQNLEFYRSFVGDIISTKAEYAFRKFRIDLNAPTEFPAFEKGDTKLRVVLMEGAFVEYNEFDDKVEVVLVNTARPEIDETYRNALKGACVVRSRIGEDGFKHFSYTTELFRYSEKPDVAEVFKGLDYFIKDHDGRIRATVVDGAYIPDNYDRDLFKVVVRLEK